MFGHLQKLSLSYYQRHFTGDLMSRMVNDVTAVRLLLGLGILNILNTPLYYAYGMSAMLAMDPVLTLVALAPYPFTLLIVRVMSRQIMQRTLRVQEGLASLSTRVQEGANGIHVIRSYGRESWQNEEFAKLNAQFKAESIALARIRGLFPPLMKKCVGAGSVGGVVVRRLAGHCGPAEPGRSGRLYGLFTPLGLAHNGFGLVGFSFAAWTRGSAAFGRGVSCPA